MTGQKKAMVYIYYPYLYTITAPLPRIVPGKSLFFTSVFIKMSWVNNNTMK